MNYEELKNKKPELNWQEAEELEAIGDTDSLNAAANLYDKLRGKRVLCSGHMGNGLVVWEKGTDNKIAQIFPDRSIKYYDHVSKAEETEIKKIAATDDRNISASQDEKVFNTRPL